jgi:hypothetical protein
LNFFCLFSMSIFFMARSPLSDFSGDIFLGYMGDYRFFDFCLGQKYLIALFEGRWAVVDRVGSGVDLVPLGFVRLEYDYIVLFLGYVLDAPKHKNTVLEFEQGMTPPGLSNHKSTSGVSFASTSFHCLPCKSNNHMSLRVWLPSVPPNISKFPLS